jgi:hypothetical protein
MVFKISLRKLYLVDERSPEVRVCPQCKPEILPLGLTQSFKEEFIHEGKYSGIVLCRVLTIVHSYILSRTRGLRDQ